MDALTKIYNLKSVFLNPKQLEVFYLKTIEALPLSEALHQHYVLNPQFTVWSDYTSPIAQKLVKAHDISHLVFGCDTSLMGEMRVQIWAHYAVKKFGIRESLKYANDKEAKVLLKNPVGYWAMFVFFIKNFNQIKKVRSQAKRMNKPWVYFEESSYMEMNIKEIRKQFGITPFA
jgi:hypothetical protein